eukprot:TRINITY_DN2200_c0_g1_i1.p1 TRINITY_DN2200_c0_g1~~TRINITY_DN2200_c0_g1_i1.p1  ORF type:complete len:248 (-),score=117.13 TRINITY_DN2200_c0_g1_i1:154-855(-)
MFKNTIQRYAFNFGSYLRRKAQAIDTLGCRLEGHFAFKENLCRHQRIVPFMGELPTHGNEVYIAPHALVLGRVDVGNQSSFMFGSVVKGDTHSVKIGNLVTVGENTVVSGNTQIGNHVTIGENSTLESCTTKDEVYIGSNCNIDSGVVIDTLSIIESGSTVTQGTQIPKGQVWGGRPAQFVREVTPEDEEIIRKSALKNFESSQIYKLEENKTPFEIFIERAEVNYKDNNALI